MVSIALKWSKTLIIYMTFQIKFIAHAQVAKLIIQCCFGYLIDWFDKYNDVNFWAHSINWATYLVQQLYV